jgi:hypothetical protein
MKTLSRLYSSFHSFRLNIYLIAWDKVNIKFGKIAIGDLSYASAGPGQAFSGGNWYVLAGLNRNLSHIVEFPEIRFL